MTKYFLITVLLCCAILAFSQEESSDSTEIETMSPWAKSWVVSLKGNQANYKDWSRGGVNSSAFAANSRFKATYESGLFTNVIRSNLRYGQVYQKGNGAQKTEDLILISNKVDYQINNGRWRTFLEVTFRTQFTKGYDRQGTLISDFLSPGYFIESLGISYQPNENFNAQIGAGLKQTTVEADGLDDYYGLVEDQDVRWEGGITFELAYQVEIFKNFTFETELMTFSNVELSWKNTDLFMTNIFTGQINSFLTSTLEWSFIYDDDFGKLLQSMRLISLGVQVKILK